MKKFLLTALVASAALGYPAAADAQVTFQQIYQASSDQSSRDVIPTSDGGYLIAGMTENQIPGDTDIYMLKTNSMGDTLWTKRYGGPFPEYPYSILDIGNGNFFIAGYTASYGAGNYDSWLLKINSVGDTLWTKTYGGPGDDQTKELIPTADGNYVMVGRSNGAGGSNYDIVLTKIDGSGNILWNKTYGGPLYETGRGVKQCQDGGFVIVGQTLSYGQGGDIYLIRTNSAGDTTWTKHYGGPMIDDGNAITANSDGSFTIVAETNSFGAGDMDVQVMKTDASGTVTWNKYYGGDKKDVSKTIYNTSDGGYIIGAISRSFGWINPDMWLVKLNAAGDSMWTRHYGSWDHEHCHAARPTADGGFIAVGHTKSYGPNSKIMFLKLNSIGTFDPIFAPNVLADNARAIFPNPTNGILNISLRGEISSVSISNVFGQELIREATDPTRPDHSVDLGNLAPGVYYITRQNKNESVTSPFILNK